VGRRKEEKHVFTADEIGIELAWLNWSHDHRSNPRRG